MLGETPGGDGLGNEPLGYPILDLRRVMKERAFDASRVVVMDIGQLVPLSETR